MTDLEFLRSRVPGYAGYAQEEARHEVDKQIRAYLGEALAAARDRLHPAGALSEQIDGLLLRCEFTDLRAIRAADHARFGEELVDRIHALDRAIVEVADRIRAAGSDDEPAPLLDEAARLMDERFGALIQAPSP
jgi:hypothetical protein